MISARASGSSARSASAQLHERRSGCFSFVGIIGCFRLEVSNHAGNCAGCRACAESPRPASRSSHGQLSDKRMRRNRFSFSCVTSGCAPVASVCKCRVIGTYPRRNPPVRTFHRVYDALALANAAPKAVDPTAVQPSVVQHAPIMPLYPTVLPPAYTDDAKAAEHQPDPSVIRQRRRVRPCCPILTFHPGMARTLARVSGSRSA